MNIYILLFLLLIISCDDAKKEKQNLSLLIHDISQELKEIGFIIDPDEINIELRSEKEISNIHDKVAQKGNFNKYNSEDTDLRLAFYDSNSQSIVLKKGAFKLINKGYLAHELIHAYQDQKWNFTNIWQPFHASSSEEDFNIISYLVEGYAELARLAYENHYGLSKDFSSHYLSKLVFMKCAICDKNTRSSVLPYTLGLKFMAYLYQEGGWPLVESTLVNIPSSSEQVLHPQKFKKDLPQTVFLPIWKDNAFGVKIISESSKGEAYLLNKLINLALDSEEAFLAASGWDGDKMHLYHNKNQEEILVWRIVFDRDSDANQLYEALRKINASGIRIKNAATIDWIIANEQITKALEIFLSQNPFIPNNNESDMQSTLAQETNSKQDDFLIKSAYFKDALIIKAK